jgi:RND family efflux transporter MFP subunit
MNPTSTARAWAAFACLSAAAVACHGGSRVPAPEASPVPVTVATAHEEPLAVVYRASGTVRGRNSATLTSKTTGYVRSVHVHPGDRVTPGQLLVELEANDVRATVARARAGLDLSTESKFEAENALEAARAAAEVAKSSYERTRQLLAEKAIPQQQYDDAEARWRAATAQEQMAQSRLRAVTSRIAESRAALEESRAMLGYAAITAPFAGIVLERRVDPGVLASPGTALLVVTDDGPPRVEVPVEESRADSVTIGTDASVEIDSLGAPIVGKVGEIVPDVDVASRTFLVKVDLPPEVATLRPGTFARVGFHTGTRSRLVVPSAAVSTFGALERVFVVDGGHARLRMITRGDSQGPWAEVLSGLSPGETVVAPPPPELRDGRSVEVRP